jgi:protein sex-lethal
LFHFQVISAKIIRDASTQYSFGYGFVEFTRPDEAARAIETLKGYPIQNKRLGVAYARVHDREALKNTNLVNKVSKREILRFLS